MRGQRGRDRRASIRKQILASHLSELVIQNLHSCMTQGNGFSFDIPSRAKGNQMYVAELDRIVLKDSISKRPFSSTQVLGCN